MPVDIAAAWAQSSSKVAQKSTDPTEIAKAWQRAKEALAPEKAQEIVPYDPKVTKAIRLLAEHDLKNELLAWYLNAVKAAFPQIESEINQYLDQFEASGRDPIQVEMLLDRIMHWHNLWSINVSLHWPESTQARLLYKRSYWSYVYAALPPRFTPALSVYLRFMLRKPGHIPVASPQFPHALTTLNNIFERYDPVLFALIYEEIEEKTQKQCEGVYDKPCLAPLLEWLRGPVMTWVSGLYARKGESGLEEAAKMLKPTFSRFEYHISKIMCRLRSEEMFDMIQAYPTSTPALEDFQTALCKADGKDQLVKSLRKQLSIELLHPGIETQDIISMYISTIKCLRIVDPQSIVLTRVAEPIRAYLRTREDTIRCIVSSFIGDDASETFKEIAASDARLLQDAKDEAEHYGDAKWTPDPIDAPAGYKQSRGSDILQLLVSIFDTKDIFVKELHVLLAQRLLSITDYALGKEIKNLEILKARFGNSSLAGCEVMIRDLQDSAEDDAQVHNRHIGSLHATIVSRMFWPSLQSSSLKLGPQLAQMRSTYNKAYTSLRPPKKLKWLPQLGTVDITLSLTDRELNVSCTPLQATIAELFGRQAEWAVEDLCAETMVTDEAVVRNALYFWNNKGVIRSTDGDNWTVVERADADVEMTTHVVEEAAPAVQSVQAKQIEDMRVHWSYIRGMLTNLGALPTTRIHSTLNMLVPAYKGAGTTQDQLVAFLEHMEVEGLVEKSGPAAWRIVK